MIQSIQNISTVSKKVLASGMLVAALAVASLSATPPAYAASSTFTVNSTLDFSDQLIGDHICDEDPGAAQVCTLRAAIQEANFTSEADVINFNIPTGGGVATIKLNSELPLIGSPVTIDGYTQPGASPNTLAKGTNAVLKIELDGTNAGSAAGLSIETSDSVVRGLVINRFKSGGIAVGGSVNKIEGNFIGTDPSGTRDRGNGFSGVDVESFSGDKVSGNIIGGFSLGRLNDKRNLISGNAGTGVSIFGELAEGNQVVGNLIGTQKDGSTALGNDSAGVGIFGGAHRSLVGANPSGSANTIAFNGRGGVLVGNSETSTTSNEVFRNSIFSNAGLGVDLGNDGPTPNDPDDPATPEPDPDSDSGPNHPQNKPVLSSAKTTIRGKLSSTPNKTFVVRFFSNPSGNEGKTFIGQKKVTTGPDGNVSFTFVPARKVGVGKTVTATATGSEGTSEFSAPKGVT